GLVQLIRWRRGRARASAEVARETAPKPAVRVGALMVIFCLTAYVVWELQFCVFRYLCPVGMLAPLLITILLVPLLGSRRGVLIAFTAVCFMLVNRVRVGDYGRKVWDPIFLDVEAPALADPGNTLVLMTASVRPGFRAPYSFVVPFFPPEVRFIKIDTPFLD